MSCDCCDSIGLYDFNCNRCLARLYVAAFPREQPFMRAKWHSSMSKEQVDEILEHVGELRSRQGRRQGYEVN